MLAARLVHLWVEANDGIYHAPNEGNVRLAYKVGILQIISFARKDPNTIGLRIVLAGGMQAVEDALVIVFLIMRTEAIIANDDRAMEVYDFVFSNNTDSVKDIRKGINI